MLFSISESDRIELYTYITMNKLKLGKTSHKLFPSSSDNFTNLN